MDIEVDFEHLVHVKNEGSDRQVSDAIMSLAGGRPSPEALQRIESMRPAQQRRYLGQLIYNLAKGDAPPYVPENKRTKHGRQSPKSRKSSTRSKKKSQKSPKSRKRSRETPN
jgi:hypothetical protein